MQTPNWQSDINLVNQTLNGNKQSFDQLYQQSLPTVQKMAFRILRNPASVEDAVQQAYLNAYKYLSYFKGESSFTTWISSIAIHVAVDVRRKLAVENRVMSLEILVSVNDGENSNKCEPADHSTLSPVDALLLSDKRKVILQAVAKLPGWQRELVVMYHLQDMSYEEIAQHLDLQLGTVKSRLARARAKLEISLSPYILG
jgi:RNA polymerase sigma-70 factor (ECF subfamily)